MAEEVKKRKATASLTDHSVPTICPDERDDREDEGSWHQEKSKEKVAEQWKKEWRGKDYEETCFTAEVIDQLIDEAQEQASAAQGSELEWRLTDSHRMQEEDASNSDGRPTRKELASQQWHAALKLQIEELLSVKGSELELKGLGKLVGDALDYLDDFSTSCRPRSTTRKYELFPLPVSGVYPPDDPAEPFLQAVVKALNSLHGSGKVGPGEKPSPVARGVIKRLRDIVLTSKVLHEPLPELTFSSFFAHRGVDYSGDEVRLAMPVCWSSIEPSLPDEVGQLDIRDFCQGGVLNSFCQQHRGNSFGRE